MSNIDKQALREKFEAWAEEAGALPWGYLKKQRTARGNYSIQIYTYMWHAWSACHEALLDELEESERLRLNFQEANCELCQKLEAAEKRIAELDARKVEINFPDRRDENYDWDGATPTEAFNTCLSICSLMFGQSLRAAGIGKGE